MTHSLCKILWGVDIIICKDQQGNPVKVKEHFKQYTLGNIMKPGTRKDLTWYAIVIGSWNMNIRNTVTPVGTLNTKLRQLKKIGYEPVLVRLFKFSSLLSFCIIVFMYVRCSGVNSCSYHGNKRKIT